MKIKPFVVGIAGGSGSGKTVFLRSLLNHFEAESICLVSQDDYYKKVAVGMTAEENKLYNFDLPDCIEKGNFEKDIQHLLNGNSILKEEYTFNNPHLKPKILEIKPAPILVIEGLFIYHYTNINHLFDYKIFIDAPEDIALERRLKRDLIERGYSKEDVLYKWNNHVMPSYQEYLLPYKLQSHQIVDNNVNELNHIHELSKLISGFIKEKI